jgi:hypothetical protein
MAKKRARIPTVAEMRPKPRVKSAFEAVLLGQGDRTTPTPNVSHGIDFASGTTAKSEAYRTMDYETAMAIQAAKDGDDSLLLPYQPTPSINPPRPRTLAAGYDSKTQTLRIRFRDGVGYEYYGVPPQVWRNFKRVKSPGRAINRTLNRYPYSVADW